jgi:hypothetical protein
MSLLCAVPHTSRAVAYRRPPSSPAQFGSVSQSDQRRVAVRVRLGAAKIMLTTGAAHNDRVTGPRTKHPCNNVKLASRGFGPSDCYARPEHQPRRGRQATAALAC